MRQSSRKHGACGRQIETRSAERWGKRRYDDEEDLDYLWGRLDGLLIIAGFMVGVLTSIKATAVLVTAESPVEELHPLFLFPTICYIVGVGVGVGGAILLRCAARRIG